VFVSFLLHNGDSAQWLEEGGLLSETLCQRRWIEWAQHLPRFSGTMVVIEVSRVSIDENLKSKKLRVERLMKFQTRLGLKIAAC
jgi:hypothetical protein